MERGFRPALFFCYPLKARFLTPEAAAALRTSMMRWKIDHRGHDPRQIDLLAALALVLVIVAACRYFSERSPAPGTASFIVPSQSVRW